VSADCAVVSEETGREETDKKEQVVEGIYITALKYVRTIYVNCTRRCWSDDLLLSGIVREEEMMVLVEGWERGAVHKEEEDVMVVVEGWERGAVHKEEEDVMAVVVMAAVAAVVVRVTAMAPLLVYICMSRYTAIIKFTFTGCAVAPNFRCWPGHTYIS